MLPRGQPPDSTSSSNNDNSSSIGNGERGDRGGGGGGGAGGGSGVTPGGKGQQGSGLEETLDSIHIMQLLKWFPHSRLHTLCLLCQ